MSSYPEISVVIPAYNEQENLPNLLDRIIPSMEKLNRTFEIVIVNDGSRDNSFSILSDYHQKFPQYLHIVDFQGNFGQHMAIMAGFEQAKGDIVVTLDADLQNPPEEIYKLIEKIDGGFDYVGSYRQSREDSFFRHYCSKIINWVREIITDIKMKDHGCMLRAYKSHIIEKIVASGERSAFIPALAYKYATNPTEVEVRHEERAAGESKYNLYSLIRLNFDLVTGFSLVPLQVFTLFGLLVSFLSGLLVVYLVGRRLIIGPEVEGVFTLFAIAIFLISVALVGIGLVGEYLGRIFQNLSNRPRYVIRTHLKPQESKKKLTKN
jgi:undecaprenyl-phosphate 4-deoxy-4-formamido-L-arabinose transferase